MSLFAQRTAAFAVATLAAVCASLHPARAQPVMAIEAAATPPENSALDSLLFYQLLIGEIELAGGKPAVAYEVVLEAARRTRNDQLFRRAVDIAIQARAGEQALAAARSWRVARPDSVDATRTEVQLLGALDRLPEAAEPLRSLIKQSPEAERGGIIAAMPRAIQRSPDRKRAAEVLDEVLAPYAKDKALAVPAKVASARGWMIAGDHDRALALAQEAARLDPAAPGPALVGLELMPAKPQAEALVQEHFRTQQPEAPLRLAYVRSLMGAQRYVEAITQLDIVTAQQPEMAAPYLSLGALHLELRHFADAEKALRRYVDLVGASPPPAAKTDGDDDDETERSDASGLVEGWLLLARTAEQRGDFAAAEGWLARIDDPKRALEVQTRRATLLARQGRIKEAREAVRRVPERQPEDARAKLVAEASVLREAKRWSDAYGVLSGANQRFPDDADLLYEQAMVAEKLDRMADAEALLRRVISIKPDNAHAHNALGYSLADRGKRLPEARQLIARALELSPGDPFITDSLGWVEFRLGNHAEAERLLRQAYASRPDVEIGAHLGEVLWTMGQKDEARRIWREARVRDATNEVLRETLARLKVNP